MYSNGGLREKMNLWLVLILSLLALACGGILYLAGRIRKFSLIRRLTGDKPGLAYFLCVVFVTAVTAALWLSMGFMNAIVCVLHLVIFWIISDIVFLVIQKYRKKSFERYYAGAAALLFSLCYLMTGWYLCHHVFETRYQISTKKQVGELRLALIADSHVGTTFHGDGFRKHLKKLEEQHPDLLVIAGDYVDDDSSREDMLECCKALGEVRTTYGVYYAFGNHDKGYYPAQHRGYDENDLIDALEANGVHVMQDDVELIDDRFYLIGRKDHFEEYGSGRKSMQELMENLDPDKYTIVLDHQPQDYLAQEEAGADLVLSGHTHGGQLFPLMVIENHINITPDDKVYGHEKRGNTDFIVTSGISDWAIKFKTGCKSEYVIVEIKGE